MLNIRSLIKSTELSGRRRAVILLLTLGLLLMLVAAIPGGTDGDAATAEEQIEERLEQMCSALDGVGKCRVMVTCSYSEARYGSESRPTVQSVAVVCKRGDRPEVRSAVTELVVSLYGIGSNRVCVSAGSP